ncbi:acyl-CoA dehydrogenase family protein [Streptomyces sp. NPDC088337]|uniref:acyl-CoA dehydrogenase family protein n=1 Tax=unclassified Streptomyces TaxID=2593676 RepID=UPI002DD9FC34|nr:acyl-CoA dehydrogenase family protein [Streptomyces sp. NBC_01788]WSB30752.1 acyl-CoA/acyl-ACP dehydrogenase [Streptomyces sp. NBC_01788]
MQARRAASPYPWTDEFEAVVREIVGPLADDVDRAGRFPSEGVRALGEAGLPALLLSRESGGAGAGLREGAQVIERLAGACGSTAMVLLMHYSALSVLDRYAPDDVRRDIAAGRHLSTLAFSERGSRSHFWAPVGTATPDGADTVCLDAQKSWVTSAGQADSYVWSSKPVQADGVMSLWLVPGGSAGLEVHGEYDGFGLRGNASSPMSAKAVRVPRAALLGADGEGLTTALDAVLPCFLVLSAAFSLGVTEALLGLTATHLRDTRLEHLDQTLAQQPLTRHQFAQLRLSADSLRAMMGETLTAVETGRPEATLRVLQIKALAAETAAAVADGAMRLCGGSAFRREAGLERRFRDALAARVMAPTTEALHDFCGRTELGLPLFEEAR